MDNRDGFAGILVLWILVGATALASSMLFIARSYRLRGDNHIDETRILYLAHAAIVSVYQAGFRDRAGRIELSGGTVETQLTKQETSAELTLVVTTPHVTRTVRTTWASRSGQWRMTGWRENV